MIDNTPENPFSCQTLSEKIAISMRYLISNDLGLSLYMIIVTFGNFSFK
jgi:hypothetical protein